MLLEAMGKLILMGVEWGLVVIELEPEVSFELTGSLFCTPKFRVEIKKAIATKKGNFRDPMAPTDEEVFESYKREMKSLQTMKSIQSMPTAETQSSHRTIQSECRYLTVLSGNDIGDTNIGDTDIGDTDTGDGIMFVFCIVNNMIVIIIKGYVTQD